MKKFFGTLCLLTVLMFLFSMVSCPGTTGSDAASGEGAGDNPAGQGEGAGDNPAGQGEGEGAGEQASDGLYKLASFDDVSIILNALNSTVSLSVNANDEVASSGVIWKLESQLNDGDLTLDGSDISATAYGAAVVSAQLDNGEKAYLAAACLPFDRETLDGCLVFASNSSFTLNTSNHRKKWDGTLETSTDGITWSAWVETGDEGNESLQGVASGQVAGDAKNSYVLVRGSGNTTISGWRKQTLQHWDPDAVGIGFSFASDDGVVPIYCFGDIRTLLNHGDISQAQMASGAFCSLFSGCMGVVNGPDLPFESLTEYCYSSMFQGGSLDSARGADGKLDPERLPNDMFVVPPKLPAMTLASHCYDNMFACRTSLPQPPALPAVTMAESCYYCMFGGCASLKTPPRLPATVLARECYNIMFHECIGLDGVVQFPVPSPVPSAQDDCAGEMYYECSKIKLSESKTGEYANEITFPFASSANLEDLLPEGVELPEDFGAGVTMFVGTGGTFTGNPVAGQKYYTSNKVI